MINVSWKLATRILALLFVLMVTMLIVLGLTFLAQHREATMTEQSCQASATTECLE